MQHEVSANKVHDLFAQFLKERNILVVGFGDKDQPYMATVYYTTDDCKNLYFKSYTESKHATLTEKNSKSFGVIYDPESENLKRKRGVQMLGKIEKVHEKDELDKSYELYCNKYDHARAGMPSKEEMLNNTSPSYIYVFRIKEFKMLDSAMQIHMKEMLTLN